VKAREIRSMTPQELEQQVLSLKEKLFKMRSENVTGRIERPHHIGQLKRDIARCYTILKEKTSERDDSKTD